MITTAPLFSLGDLARGLKAPYAEPVVMAPWLKPYDHGLLSPGSAWSLAAIATAIARRQGLAPRVLLPAWMCHGSLWPLRQTGAELLFLPVTAQGRMDWAKAEEFGTLDMVVVVHTFGHPAPLDEARAFANLRGALLVEDCAHCLLPVDGIHEAGDMVLYSPHKLLAAPSGAVIAVRPRAEAWRDAVQAALPGGAWAPVERRWLLRRLFQRLSPDSLRPLLPQGGQGEFLDDPASAPGEPPPPPSGLARRLLAVADLEREAARRQANMRALRALIDQLPGLMPLFPAGSWIPYRLAVKAGSTVQARTLYQRLRQARLPVESWPDMAPEVSRDARHADGALALRQQVLLLPVHGALEPESLALAYAEALA